MARWFLDSRQEETRGMDSIEGKHDFETLQTTIRKHLIEALTLARGNQREAAGCSG
jgi:hypothetical protein